MEKEFVTYPPALRMKALGFDEPCLAAFEDNGNLFIYWNDLVNISELFNSQRFCEEKDYECLAPTWQSAFAWFREVHGIWVTFEYNDCDCVDTDICWYVGKCFIWGIGPLFLTNELNDFKTLEEAQQACLEKLCEIVEKQKEDGKSN